MDSGTYPILTSPEVPEMEIVLPQNDKKRRRFRRFHFYADFARASSHDISPMESHELPYNRQAQTQAVVRAILDGFSLSEPLEDIRKKFGIDAFPIVVKLDFDFRVLSHQPHVDSAVGWGKLERVVQEV